MPTTLEKILLSVFLLLLPSQLGLHFWPVWSYVNYIPVDYLSPTLFFTDIILVDLLIVWGIRLRKQNNKLKIRNYSYLFIFIFLNILFSFSPLLALFTWIRYLELFLFGLYIYFHTRYLLSLISYSLFLSVLWSCLLAWWQFLIKSSVGGFWYWLGERPLLLSMPLIAKISLGSWGLFLRSYATFPHPNAFAGYLLLSGLFLFFIKKLNHLLAPFMFLISLTIFTTFSRSVIILLLISVYYLFIQPRTSRLVKILYLLFFVLTLFIQLNTRLYSLPIRFSQLSPALHLLITHPLFGVGAGNFIPAAHSFTSTTQPVHNIFLLILSENGFVFFFVLLFFIYKFLNKMIFEPSVNLLLVNIFLISLVDHYLLTLHQPTFLLVLIISVLLSLSNIKSSYAKHS